MSAVSALEILWIRHNEMTPQQEEEYDLLDYAAYSLPGAGHDESAPPTEWGSVELHCLGLLDGRMVTHVGLVERPILIAGQPFTVAGVGGVCTHPEFQRRGFARQVMEETGRFIQASPHLHLGLLFCAPHLIPYYASFGWEHRTHPLYALQFGSRVKFPVDYMLLLKPGQSIPPGEADIQSLPW